MKTIALVMMVMAAGWASAADLVVFKAAEAGLESSYEEAAKTVTSGKEVRWDFDTAKPLFAGYPQLYGGLRVVDSADTLSQTTTMLRLHDNEPAGWPGKPQLFWQGSDTSAGTNHFNMAAVFVFKKAVLPVTRPARWRCRRAAACG
jgi:hypothetical protein